MRLARRQARAAQLLMPLLYQALVPVAEAMARLDSRQQETYLELELQATVQHQENQELLLEVLQTLQPPPVQEIVRLLGLPAPPTSSPDSES